MKIGWLVLLASIAATAQKYPQDVKWSLKVYSHPPKDFPFMCNKDVCPRDMGSNWLETSEYSGKFMECHWPDPHIGASNCYEIPGQNKPACRARKGHTWFEDCVQLIAKEK